MQDIDKQHLAFYTCGAGESRTPVQTKHQETFYMLSFSLDFREQSRMKNGPVMFLISLNFNYQSEKAGRISPKELVGGTLCIRHQAHGPKAF